MARILRPAQAIQRLGVSKAFFWESIVGTGRLKLRRIGDKAVGAIESELDELIENLPIAEHNKPTRTPEPTPVAVAKPVKRGPSRRVA